MNGKLKTLIVTVCVFGLAVMLGCASFMDAITPTYIAPSTIKYADANVPIFLPYTSLFDARMVDKKMDYTHFVNTMAEDVKYKFHKGMMAFHIQAAESFQEAVFSPTGAIGLLFPTLFGGTLGALLIKRPGDKSKKNLESEQPK